MGVTAATPTVPVVAAATPATGTVLYDGPDYTGPAYVSTDFDGSSVAAATPSR